MVQGRNNDTYDRLDRRADQYFYQEYQRINKRPFSRRELLGKLFLEDGGYSILRSGVHVESGKI